MFDGRFIVTLRPNTSYQYILHILQQVLLRPVPIQNSLLGAMDKLSEMAKNVHERKTL